ncbi:hypothetical protein WMF38_57340 [Sorangium sp. So ce118]
MSRIMQAIRKALRMAGAEPSLPTDPRISEVVALLRAHGLRLAVVNAEEPSLRVSAEWLLRRATERALASGEDEYGMGARLARLIGRSLPRVSRAIRGETGLDEEAIEALEQHLLDPAKHPLPPVGKSPGRPPKSS